MKRVGKMIIKIISISLIIILGFIAYVVGYNNGYSDSKKTYQEFNNIMLEKLKDVLKDYEQKS